jgi:hypothetical protein
MLLMKRLAVVLIAFSMTGCNRAAPKNLDVYDGFETSSLSGIWDTDRFVPGAVEMQSQVFRAGHGAAKITVHSRDIFEAGIHGDLDTERAELRETEELNSRENVPYEFSFSMFFPADFPIVPTRLVIAQWKQYCAHGGNCSNDSPVLAVRYFSGVLRITQDINRRRITLYKQKDEYRNRWLDFKFRVRFSSGDDGRIQAWLNGKPLVDQKGVTANAENTDTGYPGPSSFYFKMGLYRDVMAEPMTVYVDEFHKRQLNQD